MNILVLTPYVAWPLDHGGRIRTYHMLRALARGHRVLNVAIARAPRERDDAVRLAEIGISVRPGLFPAPDMTAPARRVAKWIAIAAGRSSLPGRFWHAGFAALVGEAARQHACDLVIIETFWMDVYRKLLPGVPFVLSTHNVEADVLLEAARHEPGLRRVLARRDARLLAPSESEAVGAAAATLAVSDADAVRLRALAPGARVLVIRNGVDTEAMTLLPPAAPGGHLLFVGSFDYPANADAATYLAQDLLPHIERELGPTEVVLAGRSPTPEIQALARVPGVSVAGRVEDLRALYLDAGAVVVPIRVGGGSRLKILEALAVGRPVVTTTVGMRGLAVEHDVHVLVADTPPAFAAALARLRDEQGLAPRLAAAGRRFVLEHHAWAEIEREFADAIAGAGARPT